jgi:2-dehydropantoate 2-reductase
MGSVYATLFAEAGHEVWAIDTWADHVAAINERGLTLTGFTGDRTVRLQASEAMEDAGACEMYVLATKAGGVADAAQAIAATAPAEASVVTIQNGLGAAQRVTKHVDPNSVVLGVAQGFGASMVGPGHAHHRGMQLLRLGELDGGVTPRLRDLEKLWAGAGFLVEAYADIEQLIWEKFICNVAVGGPCLVSGLTVGELVASDVWRPVAMGCAVEAFDVAQAHGITISFDDPVAYVDAFVARLPDARPSMLQDHLAGRRSELDAINGQVPIWGSSVGVATPLNDDIVERVRHLESGM